MNVYDFDNTIYNGDSSLDFFLFCLKKSKKTWLQIPDIALCAVSYKLGRVSKEEFKSSFFSVIQYFSDLDFLLQEFWKLHYKKICDWYLSQKQSDDLVISASPVFLLEPVMEKLQIEFIATHVDRKTGMLIGKNCYGAEKVRRLQQEKGEIVIESVYTDSMSDSPLLELAQSGFIVDNKRNYIEDWHNI